MLKRLPNICRGLQLHRGRIRPRKLCRFGARCSEVKSATSGRIGLSLTFSDNFELMNNLRITYKDAYFEPRVSAYGHEFNSAVRLGPDLATNAAAAPGAIA